MWWASLRFGPPYEFGAQLHNAGKVTIREEGEREAGQRQGYP
jgi:hypothetical protein